MTKILLEINQRSINMINSKRIMKRKNTLKIIIIITKFRNLKNMIKIILKEKSKFK